MIYETFKKYKYAREYDENASVSQELIETLLKQAWEVTPSKNNFMPYKLHVIGPEHKDLKNLVYKKCIQNESKTDNVPDVETVRYQKDKPNFWNIVSCSYLLIFTQRVEDNLNKLQSYLVNNKGYTFEQMDPNKLPQAGVNARFEIGMFSAALAGLCFENDLDISHTLCFPDNLESWKEPEFSFIDSRPCFIMTIGKGTVYRQDSTDINFKEADPKPDFNRIVNILKKDQ